MQGQIILFLLFMGAEKGVNRIAGRPLMNGASCYLVAAFIFFVGGLFQVSSAQLPDGSGARAEVWAHVFVSMCGAFLFPVWAGIHYSMKFANAKAASSADHAQASS